MSDQLFVKDIVGGEAVRERVRNTDIDDTGITGYAARTTTELKIETGTIQYFVPNVDGEALKTGCIGQLTFDGDNWLWGLVMGKDYTVEPCRVKFAGLRRSASDLTARDWRFELRVGPVLGFAPGATIGFSTDTMAVPADKQVFTANIGAGLYVTRNMNLLFVEGVEFAESFRVRVLSYNVATGDGEFVCNDRRVTVAGTYSIWIVGLIPGAVTGADPAPTAVVKQAEALSAAGSITLPADIEAGDLLVLHEWALGGSLVSSAGSLGFGVICDKTLVPGTPGPTTNHRSVLHAKLADGSEASAALAVMGAGNAICHVYRPDNPASVLTIVSAVNSGSASDPASEIVAASGAEGPGVVIAAYVGWGGTVDPRSMTPAKDGETAHATDQMYLAWKLYNTSPADVTIDMDDEGVNFLQGFYAQLSVPGNQPGDGVVFENDGDDGPAYPAGSGKNIVGVPNVVFRAIVTPTLLSGNISSVDTGTEEITWSQDLRTQVGGNDVFPIIPAVGGTWPTGATTRGLIYGRFATGSDTVFTLHDDYDNATAGTGAKNLTAAGSGTRTAHTLVLSGLARSNYGLVSDCPIGGSGTYETTLGFAVNFDPALDMSNALIELQVDGLVAGTTAHGASRLAPHPTTRSTNYVAYRGSQNALPVVGNTAALALAGKGVTDNVGSTVTLNGTAVGGVGVANGTVSVPARIVQPTSWQGQGATPITVQLKAWR